MPEMLSIPLIAYAHSLEGKGSEAWEPLFTPFGDALDHCQKNACEKCKTISCFTSNSLKLSPKEKMAGEYFPGHPDTAILACIHLFQSTPASHNQGRGKKRQSPLDSPKRPSKFRTISENLTVPGIQLVSQSPRARRIDRVVKRQRLHIRFGQDNFFCAFFTKYHHRKPESQHLQPIGLADLSTPHVSSQHIAELVSNQRRRNPIRKLSPESFRISLDIFLADKKIRKRIAIDQNGNSVHYTIIAS